MRDHSQADFYDIAELAETYRVSPDEAERLIAQFGADRNGLNFLLAHETLNRKRRTESRELDGDFLFSI